MKSEPELEAYKDLYECIYSLTHDIACFQGVQEIEFCLSEVKCEQTELKIVCVQ